MMNGTTTESTETTETSKNMEDVEIEHQQSGNEEATDIETSVKGETGGVYTSLDLDGYIIGKFTSSITGKTFTIIQQTRAVSWDYNGTQYLDKNREHFVSTQEEAKKMLETENADIKGDYKYAQIFPSQCNRAAGVIILSGYSNLDMKEIVKKGQLNGKSFPYGNTNLYNNSSLRVYEKNDKISDYQTFVEEELLKGNYILIRFDERDGGNYGKSGDKWSSEKGHWIAILGYRVENGKKQIFTGDSGHGNNSWYDIDEFTGDKIDINYIYLVEPNK